jgi:glycosyltransferase involved in cell wall biosynthesis
VWKGQQKIIRGQVETFRLNILASAYKCAPDKDSESEVGWQWVFNLGRHHRITAITKKHEDPIIIHKLIKENGSDVRFIYYELPQCLRFLEKGDINHFIYYSLWQLGAFFLARRLVSQERFDLVQHLVFVNTWQPTYMAFLGIPFVFGPIGENAPMPYVIAKHYGIRALLRERVNGFVKCVSKNYTPLMRVIYNKAVRVITISDAVKSSMRPQVQKKCLVQPAIGAVENKVNVQKNSNPIQELFKVLYVGRYIYRKGPDIALKAFLQFAEHHPDVEFVMIGGGGMSCLLEEMLYASRHSAVVKILGWMDRNEVKKYMQNCDTFLFPTFEGGGAVVLEAMSFAKPVVCLDFGGPSEFITDECGIKVKISDMSGIVSGLVEALEKLYGSLGIRTSMGEQARRRFEELYTWRQKVNWMNQVYKEALSTQKVD